MRAAGPSSSRASALTIACDVGGIFAPLLDQSSDACVELPQVNPGTHVLRSADDALGQWHYLGAQVQWHSTS